MSSFFKRTIKKHSGLARFFIAYLLLVGNVGIANAAGEKPVVFVNPVGPPVAPEGIRVNWSYEGSGVYYFVIEREEPYTNWTSNEFVSFVHDTSVHRGRVYRYRVCAVYDTYRACNWQDWISAQLPEPQNGNTPPPPPALPPIPKFTVRSPNGVQIVINWDFPYQSSSNITSGKLYRDDQLIYEVPPSSGLGAVYVDNVKLNSTHFYKLCFKNATGETCGGIVKARPMQTSNLTPVLHLLLTK